ncbi:MAG: class I SAM-dependent methyltransferase [Geminicoccaceae bacterium]
MSVEQAVAAHYGQIDVLGRIEAALKESGKDPAKPTVDDLAGVDEFHARGREATVELADWLPAAVATEVLDIGSGLGGPARFLAATRGLRVVGVDLTPEYVTAATELTRRCGLADRARFLTANALDLPFEGGSFAAAYTQHVAMNISDKATLYAEAARVLRPRAVFVIYDILRGPGGAVQYPTPWSADGSTSFLVDLPELLHLLDRAGFAVEEHRDLREASAAWFEQRAAVAAAGKGPPMTIRLLLGQLFAPAFANLLANLRSGAVAPTMLRAVRR